MPDGKPYSEAGEGEDMKDLDFIFSRRSIRSYSGEKIDDATMDLILKAGLAAPSGHNSQPWEFIVIRNRETLNQLSVVREYWKMLQKADVAIAVVADISNYGGSSPEFFIQDCAAAAENMLLAANALGAGGTWLGIHPMKEVQKQLREILNVPEDIIPVCMLTLGIPKAPKPPKTEFNMDKVHYETY